MHLRNSDSQRLASPFKSARLYDVASFAHEIERHEMPTLFVQTSKQELLKLIDLPPRFHSNVSSLSISSICLR